MTIDYECDGCLSVISVDVDLKAGSAEPLQCPECQHDWDEADLLESARLLMEELEEAMYTKHICHQG